MKSKLTRKILILSVAIGVILAVGLMFFMQSSLLNNAIMTGNIAQELKQEIANISPTADEKFTPVAIDEAGQKLQFLDKDGVYPINSISVNSKGMLSSSLEVDNGTSKFIGFYVLKNTAFNKPDDETSWVNLGTGYPFLGSSITENRLNFFNDQTGIYLINDAFINAYGGNYNGTNSIVFKAVYSNDEPISLSFDTAEFSQRSFGQILIDGQKRDFGSSISFNAGSTNNVSLKILSNPYRIFKSLEISEDGADFKEITTTQNGNEFNANVAITKNSKLKLTFEAAVFDIEVRANIDEVNKTANAIIGTKTGKVSLGSTFDGVTISSVEGYRLVNPNFSNYQIFNKSTNLHDTFSAINGSINIKKINEVFFDNYLNNNKIEIIALYVKQFNLEVNVNDGSIGSFFTTITAPDGTFSNPSTLGAFDENSLIEIDLITSQNTSVDSINGLNDGELNKYKDNITFTLTENRKIDINFDVLNLHITASAKDEDMALISDQTLAKIEISNDAVLIGDVVASIEKNYDTDFYKFTGWFAEVNGTLKNLIDYIDIGDGNIYNLFIDVDFIDKFFDGDELKLVARFSRLFAISYDANLESGTFKAESGYFDSNKNWISDKVYPTITDEDTQTYSANTLVRITGSPIKFYYLKSVDGLYENEKIENNTVYATVDGMRYLTINFEKKPTEIKSDESGVSHGSITLNKEAVTIDENLILSFTPATGYTLKSWKINGTPVENLPNARFKNNTLSLTITEEFLANTGGVISHQVKTAMNLAVKIAFGAAAVLVPCVIIAIALITRRHKQEKLAYAIILASRKENENRMKQTNVIKNIFSEQKREQEKEKNEKATELANGFSNFISENKDPSATLEDLNDDGGQE